MKRSEDFYFGTGEKSPLPPLEKPKPKEPEFAFRGTGLDEFKISPQELVDQGIETDDEGEQRVLETNLKRAPYDLNRSEDELLASRIESKKDAEARSRDINLSRKPGGLEDFRVDPKKLQASGVEDAWAAAKRVAETPVSDEPHPFRGPITSKIIESDAETAQRLAEPKKDEAALQDIEALRIEVGRLEADYAQMETDIISLRGKIEEQSDATLREAQKKVLQQFERERLVINEQLKQTEKELKEAEERAR